jgi:hypothetical protein
MTSLMKRLSARKGAAMARALTRPSTLVITGAVAAGGIAAGLPAIAIGGITAAAYGLASLFTIARPKELARMIFPDIGIDLSRLDRVGVEQLQRARSARESYREALRGCPPGPFREHFANVFDQVSGGVEKLYHLIAEAQSLRAYLSAHPPAEDARRLAQLRPSLRAEEGSERDEIAAQVSALEQQISTRARIQAAHDAAVAKIAATTARVEQLAAQLTEIVLLSDETASVAALPDATSGVAGQVAGLVEELDSMRKALDEVGAEPLPHATGAEPPQPAPKPPPIGQAQPE